MTKQKNIGIIGAGIGGLASAIFLARKGHKVTIFEKFSKAKPLGAGFLLQPPGQAILKDLGIYETVKAKSAVTRALISKTPCGNAVLDLHYADLSGDKFGLGIRRPVLHKALLDAALGDNIELKLGADIVGFDCEKGLINETSNTYGPYNNIIVANGARGELVDAYIKRTHKKYHWSCVWANVTLPSNLPQDVLSQRVQSTRHMIGLSPIGPLEDNKTEAAFFWSLEEDKIQDWYTQSYDDFVGTVREIWPEAAEAIAPLSHEHYSHAVYYDIWCKKPWNQRLVVIGDAIHGTSPQLGQGVTMALLDAKSLADAINMAQDTDAAYNQFWGERKKQLRYVRWTSRLLTPFFQSNSRVLGWIRDIGMAMGTSRWIGKRIALGTLASELDGIASILRKRD